MALSDTLTVWAPRLLSVTRAMAGLLYLQHGLQKLFVFPGPMPPPPGAPPPPGGGMGPPQAAELLSFMGMTGCLELVGGLLLVVGLFTRPVAFILSGMMAVAYFMVHAPKGFYPILNGGDLAILFCFFFLYLFFAGGGVWSLDAMMARRKAEAAAG